MVVGIGGTFIYARDATALARWYSEVLGIETGNEPETPYFHEFPVREAEGEHRLTRCVWAIFQSDNEHPASPASYTINYRVDDIEAVLERAAAQGVSANRREDGDYGRFAWLTDPEGREVELFEDTQSADEP
jgi:predicted enzyme related to lactoylglutathione lyase